MFLYGVKLNGQSGHDESLPLSLSTPEDYVFVRPYDQSLELQRSKFTIGKWRAFYYTEMLSMLAVKLTLVAFILQMKAIYWGVEHLVWF
jgi:hypothetical protein